MKFEVDKDLCIGCGACASICEEVFEINDEGYAEAKNDIELDDGTKENAIEATENCPTNAIKSKND